LQQLKQVLSRLLLSGSGGGGGCGSSSRLILRFLGSSSFGSL
jgi:hypothetical protein